MCLAAAQTLQLPARMGRDELAEMKAGLTEFDWSSTAGSCWTLRSSDRIRSAPAFLAAAMINASQKPMRASSSIRKATEISAVVVSTHQTT